MRSLFLGLVVILASAPVAVAEVSPRTALQNAMKTGTCDGVPDQLFSTLTDKERHYLTACWRKGQRLRLEEAERTGTCTPLLELPGVYPLGTDAELQRVYGCWLSEGYLVHDAALGAAEVPHDSLIPGLLHALDLNPPQENGQLVCTTAHILGALTAITGKECGKTSAGWRTCLKPAEAQN